MSIDAVLVTDGNIGVPAIPGVARRDDGRLAIARSPAALYGLGYCIRRAEQLLLDLFSKGLVSGTTHTCIGQELCQMAVVRALRHADDAVLSNHRNHGHFLTYSGNFLGLIAEVMGREAGVCGGRGGSQHLAWHHFHSNGVQGGMTAIGVGLARAKAEAGSSGIVAVMLGDGTLGEGLVYESMNLAALWSAPVLFVVEHNGIAQTTPTSAALAGNMLDRGKAFGLACWEVADDEPGLWQVAERAVEHVRQHRQPGFLVIRTARLGPHSKGDDLRDATELAALRERDPLARLGAVLEPQQRHALEAACDSYLATVLQAAKASPEARFRQLPRPLRSAPAPVVPATVAPAPRPQGEVRTVRASLNAALDHLLATDPRVLLLGEDLHDPYGGAFKVTAGLSTRHGDRVLSTPISEGAITGAAIGLAMAGRRPVVEVMFADFLTLCADQLYNHAVKFPGLFPELSVPLVIRAPAGGRRGYGPTHSQCPEALFSAMPGLTVVHGSHRHDMGRLLEAAVRHWLNPTLFLEHKLLYGVAQERGRYEELDADPRDAGSALFPTLHRRGGSADAVILAYGGMLPVAEEAADRLAKDEEIAADIVAPALLAPLPRHALVQALQSYACIVVAEEGPAVGGVGAEILACLAEAGYRGRVSRLAAPPVPIPSARTLEAAVLPDADRLVAAVLDTL